MYWRGLNSTEPSESCRSFEALLHCERRQISSCLQNRVAHLVHSSTETDPSRRLRLATVDQNGVRTAEGVGHFRLQKAR